MAFTFFGPMFSWTYCRGFLLESRAAPVQWAAIFMLLNQMGNSQSSARVLTGVKYRPFMSPLVPPTAFSYVNSPLVSSSLNDGEPQVLVLGPFLFSMDAHYLELSPHLMVLDSFSRLMCHKLVSLVLYLCISGASDPTAYSQSNRYS